MAPDAVDMVLTIVPARAAGRRELALLSVPRAAADDVEEHVLERFAAVSFDQNARGFVLQNAARVEQDDAVGKSFHFRHVVGGEQYRGAAGVGVLLQLLSDPVRRVWIERGGRLVEQQQLGRIDQRLGETDARLLTGRQLAGVAVEQLGELQILGKEADALGHVGNAIKTGIDGQVLAHGEPHRQVDIGALEIQPFGDPIAVAAHIGAEHPHLTGGRHHEAEQHGDSRGFAGAVAAEQCHRCPRLEREADATDRRHRAVNLGEVLDRDGDRFGGVRRNAHSLVHG